MIPFFDHECISGMPTKAFCIDTATSCGGVLQQEGFCTKVPVMSSHKQHPPKGSGDAGISQNVGSGFTRGLITHRKLAADILGIPHHLESLNRLYKAEIEGNAR